MTQSDVINYFAERTGMKRAQVKQLFEDLANLATTEVKSNGEFVLPGFGKLVRSERKARHPLKAKAAMNSDGARWTGTPPNPCTRSATSCSQWAAAVQGS